jgi:hypothetical protein
MEPDKRPSIERSQQSVLWKRGAKLYWQTRNLSEEMEAMAMLKGIVTPRIRHHQWSRKVVLVARTRKTVLRHHEPGCVTFNGGSGVGSGTLDHLSVRPLILQCRMLSRGLSVPLGRLL